MLHECKLHALCIKMQSSLPTAPFKQTQNRRPPRYRTLRTIIALMLREMASTYGNSPGGYFWALLQPIGMLIVLSLGFSLILRSPSLGTSFLLFYAAGFLPFNLYMEIQGKISGTLNYAKALLAYPAVTWIDAFLARLTLNIITSVVVMVIVFVGIFIYDDIYTSLKPIALMNAIAMASAFGLGVGLINAVLEGLFPVWSNIWRIITRPLFLASGVLNLYDDMPRHAQDVLWWNPLFHITATGRAGFFPTYEPAFVSYIYVYGVSMILILLGLIFMRANYTNILER
jgi:capsular polysaccharide transport system permease protein